MHFRYHKYTLIALIVIELLLAWFSEVEFAYNLHLLMGAVYFAVSFWFVFGARRWWLYQAAGVGYVAYVILNRILLVFQMPLPRGSYHLILAALWGLVLAVHLFVEREIGPPTAKPFDQKGRYSPPDADED